MRQFVSSVMPDKKGRLILTAKERRYLVNVLRLCEGSAVDVRLPNGNLIPMQIHISGGEIRGGGIVELLPSRLSVDSNDMDEVSCHVKTEFWLFQFLPKSQKMDLIVRQATECGVSIIVPVLGEYSVGAKDSYAKAGATTRIDRWERIIREARQQSGSPIATRVLEPVTPEQAITLWHDAIMNGVADFQEGERLAFMLCEHQKEQDGLYSALRKKNTDLLQRPIALAIGCEGGISSFEIELFGKNGFMPIHFKTNVLRTETAALYGLAVLQTAITEYESWISSE